MSPVQLSQLLREAVERELPNLRAVADSDAAVRPNGPASWSPKEELGHLLDSAVNNHIRFVGAVLNGVFRGPGYAQDAWVSLHGYRDTPWNDLVSGWYFHNLSLIRMINNIPENSLTAPCFIGAADPETLAFIVEDYVLHMRHHIDNLLKRQHVTEYPRPERRIGAAAPF